MTGGIIPQCAKCNDLGKDPNGCDKCGKLGPVGRATAKTPGAPTAGRKGTSAKDDDKARKDRKGGSGKGKGRG